jgi:response regulator NasT
MTTSLRIAVADDEPFMRDYLQQTLMLLGHRVVAAAANGQELVDACAALHPEVVIIDVNMPEKDGLTAAADIYRTQPVPIILLSANYGPEFIRRAQDSHVLAYLVKPIKRGDLVSALEIAQDFLADHESVCPTSVISR